MKQLKRLLLSLLAVVCLPVAGQTAFVTVKDGHFLKDGKPYYYVGTNFWYGAILGSEGQGGDRKHEEQWQVGDDYKGDPAQEQQGLNSVFAGDKSTLKVIKSQVKRMIKIR